MAVARVSSKGWVVIPSAIRSRFKIKPGDVVEFVEYGGVLRLVPIPPDPVRALRGIVKTDTPLSQALLEDRARERVREVDSPG